MRFAIALLVCCGLAAPAHADKFVVGTVPVAPFIIKNADGSPISQLPIAQMPWSSMPEHIQTPAAVQLHEQSNSKLPQSR
jgi:hypothetical protein